MADTWKVRSYRQEVQTKSTSKVVSHIDRKQSEDASVQQYILCDLKGRVISGEPGALL